MYPKSLRSVVPFTPRLRLGELEVDILNRQVRVGGQAVHLSPLQQALLYLLAANAGRVMTREEIAAWVRTGGEERDIDETRVLLGELLPGTTFKEFRKRPCLVCATATDRPYIDWADERTIVLVEGERGAMSGDEIGRLASSLALTGAWSDTIPQEVFAAVWAEPGWRTTTMLAGLGG